MRLTTDSMITLGKIKSGWLKQWLESLRRSKLTKICLTLVPRHVGVKGNERADMLTGTTTVENG